MDVPEAKQYLAVLVDSAARVLLRRRPGPVGGYFIRTELTGDETPAGAVIASVFNESGLRVRVVSVGEGVYFGGGGTCTYFVVEQTDLDENIEPNGSVEWFSIEDARSLMLNLRNDNEFELEICSLNVAREVIADLGVLRDGELKCWVGTSVLESFKYLCLQVEHDFLSEGDVFFGLGINSNLVVRLLAETKEVISGRGGFESDYVNSLMSFVGSEAVSGKHEECLAELILIFAADALCRLKSGDIAGYKRSYLCSCEYLDKRRELYPEESRDYRRRARAGGRAKADNRNRREDLVRKTIIDVLQEKFPFRARVGAGAVVDRTLDEVLLRLQQQGVKHNGDDIKALMIDLLVNDSSVKKIVGRL